MPNAKKEEETVVEEVTEAAEQEEKKEPLASNDLWPFEVAVWENDTQRGGTSHRVQLTVSRIDQNGNRKRDNVYFSLREAFAACKVLAMTLDEALRRKAARK